MEDKNYFKQANDFLAKHDLTLDIREAIPQKSPLWAKEGEKHGINYYCVLQNKEGKKYSFDFWGSIADMEKVRYGEKKSAKPTNYSILACLDTYSDGSSFEDFCAEMGFDTDSITALKTYEAVQKQIEGLKSVMSVEALEELNEIQ